MMERRTFMKAALIAAATPTVALAPTFSEISEIDIRDFLATATPDELSKYHLSAYVEAMKKIDPRAAVRGLANQVSELMDGITDYERLVIKGRSTGPWAIYTEFDV
jgi:uncharacterized short protein YbdD (DUF466 family)